MDLSDVWMSTFAPDIFLVSLCSLTFWQDANSAGVVRFALTLGTFYIHYVSHRPTSYALNLWSLATFGFLFLASFECIFVQKLAQVQQKAAAKASKSSGCRAAKKSLITAASGSGGVKNYYNSRFVTNSLRRDGSMTHFCCSRSGSLVQQGTSGLGEDSSEPTTMSRSASTNMNDDRSRLYNASSRGRDSGLESGSSRGSNHPASIDFLELNGCIDENVYEDQSVSLNAINLLILYLNSLLFQRPTTTQAEVMYQPQLQPLVKPKVFDLTAPIDNLFKVLFPSCYFLFLSTYFTHYLN